MRSKITTLSVAAAMAVGVGATSPAFALSGLLYGLLPPFPNLPATPPLLEDLPYIDVPTGLLPNGTIAVPLPIPALPITNSLLPANGESNTISNCGAGADLRQAAVFTALNLQPNNQIMAFTRNDDGTLCQAGVYNTGGSSDLLGIVASGQNAVISDGEYVFNVNPVGSDNILYGNGSVSVFRIEAGQLVLTDVEDAGNTDTHSVAKFGNLVYAVSGGFYQGTFLGPRLAFIPQSVRGWTFDPVAGDLSILPGSDTRTLDAAGDAAQIGFTGDGQHLVISNRATTQALTSGVEPDTIEVMTLGANGTPVRVQAHDVDNDTPFGFRTIGNNVYLTMGGATQNPNGGGAGVYQIQADGGMETITSALIDGGTDTCWNAVTTTTAVPYMFTSAFFDSAIARYQVQADGSMSLINGTYDTTSATGSTNYLIGEGGLDMSATAQSNPTEFVYVINNPAPPPIGIPVVRIVGFQVVAGGSDMVKLGSEVARGLPNTGWGLWAL